MKRKGMMSSRPSRPPVRKYTRRRYITTTPRAARQAPPFTVISQEKKFFDSELTTTTVTSAGVILSPSINLISAGTGESQRIGRKCKVTSIHLKGSIVFNDVTDANTTSDIVRVILYLDKQCNGATAAVADILDLGQTTDVYAFRNLQNSSRFRVLYDKSYSMQSPSGAFNGTTVTYGEDLKGLKINVDCMHLLEFDASTSAITDLTSNNFGIMAISRNGNCSIDYQTRVRFYG